MPVVAYLLFVLVFMKEGPPQADYKLYGSKAECVAAQASTTKSALEHGIQVGSITCTEIPIGEFS